MNSVQDNILRISDYLGRPRHLRWVTEQTGYSKQSIYRLMKLGEFPKSIRLGANKVAWLESDVISWLDSRIQASRKAA